MCGSNISPLRALVRRCIVPTQAKANWTHPCQCTLIAHGTPRVLFALGYKPQIFTPHTLPESCLLHWIQSSQENQTRVEKAFKCPQCGVDYEIESDNPPALRLMNRLNKLLTSTGKFATVVGMGTTIFTFGTCASVCSGSVARAFTLTDCVIENTGIWLMCTTYGAWAVREFLGQEM